MRLICVHPGCGKWADRKNGKYCSKEHAPYGRLLGGNEHSTKSGKMVESGTVEPGERFQEQSRNDNPKTLVDVGDTTPTQNSEQSSLRRSKSGTATTENEQENKDTQHGQIKQKLSERYYQQGELKMQEATKTETESKETGIVKTENSISKQFMKGETDETQTEQSDVQLLNSDQERLASTNLVDESIQLLNLQMKRLVSRTDTTPIDEKMGIERSRMACKTADVMAKMVKVKIDAYKAFNPRD